MKKLFVILLIIIGLVAWLWGVNDAYVGIYNTNNNYLALASRNFLRFGILPLKFAPTYFAGGELPAQVEYYLHHPILMFYFALMPFKLFGFANWVVRAATGVFLFGAMGMIYLLGKEIWNKRVGLWAMILAIWFPMASFFWKYIFFEQATLFFNLIIIYCVVRYIKSVNNPLKNEIASSPTSQKLRGILAMTSGHEIASSPLLLAMTQGHEISRFARNDKKVNIWLMNIGLFTFLSTATDWYGGYLLFPFLFLLLSPYRREIWKILLVYFPVMTLTIIGFIAYVYILEGSLVNVSAAVVGRAVNAELFGLSFWPARLFVISIIRIILYFTPLGVLGGIWAFWGKLRVRKWHLGEWVLVSLFILGILNIVFLPTASWGHSYFLFYLIPFFAYSGAQVFEKLRGKWLVLATGSLVMSAIGVQYLKQIQVKKQLWKYEVAKQVNEKFAQYETIGMVYFPGDVMENYFLHPSRPIEFDKLPDWVDERVYPEVDKLVFSCAGECTEGELAMISKLRTVTRVIDYKIYENMAWLVEKNRREVVVPSEKQGANISSLSASNTSITKVSLWVQLYRKIRDIIGATQI